MPAIHLRDRLELFVESRGEGTPLVLLHGFTGSSQAWPAQALARLEAGYRVHRLDLLGHGRASRCTRPERHVLDEQVADVVQVLDALGIERSILVGYSMGGRVALGTAVLQPLRVQALVLEGASPGLESVEERTQRRASDTALAARLESDGIEAFVDHWMQLPLFDTQRRLPDDLRERERARRLTNDPASLAACLRGLGVGVQPSLWSRLAHVRVPALLLAGEHDAKFTAIARRMAAAMPLARTATVAGCGHTTHLESPPAWGEAVAQFLAGLECEKE